MALAASLLRSKSGPAIRGKILPTPTTANDIPGVPRPTMYPRLTYNETWKITGATSITTLYQASAATGLPQAGSAGLVENGITLTVVSSVDLQKTDNETVWMATVNYEPNPLILPLDLTVHTSHRSRRVYKFWNKDNKQFEPIGNALFEIPDHIPEDDEPIIRIELARRVQSFNHSWPATYCDHQNSEAFMGFGKGTVMMTDLRGTLTYDPITYYLMTGSFEVRLDNWSHKFVERGKKYLESTGGGIVTKTVWEDANPTGMPVFLDKNGYKLAQGSPPTITEWDTVLYANFNALPFFT